MYNLEKERLFTLDTGKHLSRRRLRIIAESHAIQGLYFASFLFLLFAMCKFILYLHFSFFQLLNYITINIIIYIVYVLSL